MKLRASALAVLLVVSMVGAAAAPAAGQQGSGSAYSGAHVQFQTQGSSISDYAVADTVLVDNVSVQSSSKARNQAGVGVDVGLEAMTGFSGAGLEMSSKSSAGATVSISSGAEMTSTDCRRGIFQIRSENSDQMVQANLSSGSQAESAGEKRVVVTKDDGTKGAFIVVGDGEVVVNNQGNVTAEVKQGSQLVYRQYPDERDDDDEQQEQMIQDGTATAEVYIQKASQSGEDSSNEGEQAAANVVQYGQDTTVEVTSQSKNNVEMTVERSQSQGKVILTSVSDEAFDNAQDIEVFVDGEAAARADSFSEVKQSASQGDEPRYYVAQSSSAEASTDVAIGVDHFSSRDVQMTSGDGDGDGATDGTGAGFGALVALAAIGGALVAMRRRY